MQLEKRHLLILIAIVCLVLWYCGSENIPFLEYLPVIAGGLHAFNLIANLAKQPAYEPISETKSTSQFTNSKSTRNS